MKISKHAKKMAEDLGLSEVDAYSMELNRGWIHKRGSNNR
jgi:hypothetical protein